MEIHELEPCIALAAVSAESTWDPLSFSLSAPTPHLPIHTLSLKSKF